MKAQLTKRAIRFINKALFGDDFMEFVKEMYSSGSYVSKWALFTNAMLTLLHIHAKYSRIKITVTDFSNKPSTILSFYLKPAEIRRLYWQARVVKGPKEFSVSWQKKKDRKGKVIAESMNITHEPWRDKEKKERSNYPWRISISAGEYKNGSNKPVYDKRVFKMLSDDEFEDFFSDIIAYLNAWETIIGAPLIKDIHLQMSTRFREKDETLEERVSENGSASHGFGGYTEEELA